MADKRYVVASESSDGKEWRTMQVMAPDEDEARLEAAIANRELARSESAPESVPYKVVGVELAEGAYGEADAAPVD